MAMQGTATHLSAKATTTMPKRSVLGKMCRCVADLRGVKVGCGERANIHRLPVICLVLCESWFTFIISFNPHNLVRGRHHDLTLQMKKVRPQRVSNTQSAKVPPLQAWMGSFPQGSPMPPGLHVHSTNSKFMPHMKNCLHTQKPDVFSLHQHRVHRVNACFSFE